MYLQRDCPSGIRFLAAVKQGNGLKPSARAAGIGIGIGYRWLRESFSALREQSVAVAAAQVQLGFHSPMVLEWEARRVVGGRRHHLSVEAAVEDMFWGAFLGGANVNTACVLAGVGRSTGYRWWRIRFDAMRQEGKSVRVVARALRVSAVQAQSWDAERRQAVVRSSREHDAAERRAVRESARYAEKLAQERAPRFGRAAARHAVLGVDAFRVEQYCGVQTARCEQTHRRSHPATPPAPDRYRGGETAVGR